MKDCKWKSRGFASQSGLKENEAIEKKPEGAES